VTAKKVANLTLGELAVPKIWSEFALRGERLEPPIITRRLAGAPSSADRVGDPIIAGKLDKAKRRTNAWIPSVGPERSHALDEQVELLIAQLKPKTAEIVELREEFGLELQIACVVYVADETPAIWFSSDVVGWASRVGTGIWVDLYLGRLDETLYSF
jgi:hypothetical protein